MSDDFGELEEQPAFGMIGAFRVATSPPGSVLFDSDIRHQHTIMVRIGTASRKRGLHHDWIHDRKQLIEIEMSEAQWASFVSSMNTSGVPCTLRRVAGAQIERLDYAPRLEQSMRETREAAHEAFDAIKEALADYEDKPSKAKLSSLRATIENATPNVDFAGKSLAEHAENVVTKARADIETMVALHAERLQVEAPDSPLQLEQ